MSSATESTTRHYTMLIVLVLAGEVIFCLPFHIPRFFRPSMLEVFQLSHTQLGDIFAVYGVVALLAYFPGGALADRFPARVLISLSLAATAFGGFYLYTLPGTGGLYLLFAYWGVTSILLFWAALIKATREWGGAHEQGIAFGILEGGRGFIASLLSTVAVYLLARKLGGAADSTAGMQLVILFYTVIGLLAAAVVWFTLPHVPPTCTAASSGQGLDDRPHWRRVLSDSRVYLQAGVVICAYCGYKSLDNYGVYAVEVLQMTPLASAELTTYAGYSRPVAAVVAGLLADRWRPSRLITLLFACLGLAFFTVSRDAVMGSAGGLLLANLMITFVAVYALRGIYFSLVAESGLDDRDTGTAVGLISLVGFTPDAFFGALTGRLLDANPGVVGFQQYFLLMTLVSVAGMLFALALARRIRNSGPSSR